MMNTRRFLSHIVGGPRRLPALALAILSTLSSGCFNFGGDANRPTPPSLPEALLTERSDLLVRPMAGINSSGDDFGATMPIDSSIVYFTSSRVGATGKHSIFYSRSSGGSWSVPKLAVVVNNSYSNGVPSISAGGERMYFTGCDYGLGDCDLYSVDVGPRGGIAADATPWSIPTNVGLPVNGTYWDSQPCISSDGSILYFSSDRPGGLGGKDIWACRRGRDGAWEAPVNAGPKINTSFDEITPWLTPDAQTLLFCSNGHPGRGGFDVFAATTTMGGIVVTDLPAPVNSDADEISFSLSADGRRAFLASNRGDGMGGYDLYEVSPVPVSLDPVMIVQGTVRGSQQRVMASIDVIDLTSAQTLGTVSTDPSTGEYTLVLPRGFNYALTAHADGHLFTSEQLTVPADLERDASRRLDFTLQPIEGSIRLLVFFKPNDRNLERESMSDLDRAARFLEANPEVKVELAGHSDDAGNPKANLTLSTERAQSVKSYLVGHRIDADRIAIRGYGDTQPIASGGSEEERALNRRVEMRVKR